MFSILGGGRRAAAGGGVPVIEGWVASNSGGVADYLLPLTAPAGITAGDLLVLFGTSDNSYTAFGTAPNGWTRQGEYSGNGVTAACFYKIATGSEGNITLDSQPSSAWGDKAGWYLRISGANGTTPVNAFSGGTSGSATNHSIPSVTTTVNNCLMLFVLAFDGGDGTPLIVSGSDWWGVDEETNNAASNGLVSTFGTKDMPAAGAAGATAVNANTSDGASYFQVAISPA